MHKAFLVTFACLTSSNVADAASRTFRHAAKSSSRLSSFDEVRINWTRSGPPEGGSKRRDELGDERTIVEESSVPARHVAVTLLGILFFGPVMFAMTETKVPHIALYTFLAIEQIVAVFVAVMIFQSVDDIAAILIESQYGHQVVREHHGLIAGVHAACWLPLGSIIAFYMPRGHAKAVFCGLGAHVLSFFAFHASLTAQEALFAKNLWWCIFGFFVMAFICTLVTVAGYFGKRFMLGAYPGSEELSEDDEDWINDVDDIEDEFLSMAMAIYVTMAVRFIILGRFPHFEGVKPGDQPMHQWFHRTCLWLYLLGLILVAYLYSNISDRLTLDASYEIKRVSRAIRSFLQMALAWAFLLLGHWEIYERHFHWAPMFARLVFSSICTGLLLISIPVIARYFAVDKNCHNQFGLITITLIVGFTWEETINHSLDVVLMDVPNKYYLKVLVATCACAVLIPIWAIYMKPKAMQMELDNLKGQVERLEQYASSIQQAVNVKEAEVRLNMSYAEIPDIPEDSSDS